ncbi:MFS transporter [Posidoniimonas corsicana]|uniref:MFS transporter n=1 Tax=Posidoniimonas corsicana TaxID=1938618 RepID=UPI0011B6886F|nr:MFS transporter [Posidoniimonas corsicana]
MAFARSSLPLRRAVRLANVNAALWATGAGLTPTLLVTYLAMEHGAQGFGVSWVLAAPRFAGLLRLLVPAAIGWLGSRKRVCVFCYAGSAGLLAALPVASAPTESATTTPGLATLLVLWTGYQVLEYFGTTALWSWLGDLYPPRVRGRMIGVREKWLTRGQIAGALSGFLITSTWGDNATARWVPLAASTCVGALFMASAVAPLAAMPNLRSPPSLATGRSHRRALNELLTSPLLRLLAWSMLLSVANGIAAAARGVYPYRVLGLAYPTMLTLTVGMRAGQSLTAPAAGRWVDRWGVRRMDRLRGPQRRSRRDEAGRSAANQQRPCVSAVLRRQRSGQRSHHPARRPAAAAAVQRRLL